MADLVQNISNSLNLFGGSPSSKWNAYNWGSFLWGEGTANTLRVVDKLIENSQASDTTITKQATYIRTISNSQAMTSDPDLLTVSDGSGYDYVVPDDTTDWEERYDPTYTEQSNPADNWTAQTFTTNWS